MEPADYLTVQRNYVVNLEAVLLSLLVNKPNLLLISPAWRCFDLSRSSISLFNCQLLSILFSPSSMQRGEILFVCFVVPLAVCNVLLSVLSVVLSLTRLIALVAVGPKVRSVRVLPPELGSWFGLLALATVF